jgi:hypothetical protein
MNIMGTGTMICARNAGVDEREPHVATKWITLFFFRLWSLGTYRLQVIDSSGVGLPFIGGKLSSKYAVLAKLPWTRNKGHIIRSLIVGWGFFGAIAFAYLLA